MATKEGAGCRMGHGVLKTSSRYAEGPGSGVGAGVLARTLSRKVRVGKMSRRELWDDLGWFG